MSQQMSGTPSTPDVKSSLPIADIFKTPDHLDRTPESASTKASIKTSPAREPSTQNVDVTLAQALGWPEECRILLRRVQTGQPLSDRVYAANALGNAVDEFSLGSVTQIWSAAKDLIASDLPKDARRAGFSLLASCVKQPNLAPLERRQFFETLSRPCNIDDFGLQLKALVDLTNHGKDVSSFESVLLPWVTKLLEEWFVAARSSRKRAKEKKTKPVSATSHENNLNDLFGFVKELVRFSFVTFQGQELCLLLDQILQICKSTTAESDIRNSIDIIDMLVTYGEVPPTKHALILEVLCGAYAFLENLKELTWKVIGNFCKSHLASNTVVILLSFIHSSNEDSPPRNSHCIRGALLVIDGLMKARGSEGLFLVTFSIWMDAIEKALETDNARLDFDVIHAVAGFLQTDPLLNDAVQEEDLSRLFSALTTCSRSTPDAEVDLPVDKRLSGISQKVSESKKERDPKLTVLQDLSQIFEILETQYSNLPVLRGPIVRYFFSVRSLLPDSSAALLVKHYTKEQLCHPSHEDWSDNMATLVRTFFEDRQRQAPLRLLILSMAYDVYEAASIHLPPDPIKGSFLPLIESMRFETDIDVLEHMVTLAVLMANHSHEEVFSSVMECFNACREAFKETTSSRASSSSSSEISANKVSLWPSKAVSTLQSSITSGIVRIFLRTMNRSAGRAIEAFDMLLEIARSQSNATTEARLTALKLLFRLRSDSSSSIMVLDSIDVANTANLLGRTVNSLEKRMADGKSYDRPAGDNTESTLPSRKKSIQHLQRQFNHSKTENRAGGASDSTRRLLAPLWAFPESKALPEAPPKRPSDVLVSSSDALQSAPSPEAALEVNTDTIPYKRVLNIKMWLELLISNVREYNNWEVYSYTIVYLQNQLANHSLFVESVPQIQMLRSVLCDHIRAANFLDGLNVRDVKRADVAVCLVHLLTGLVSYHTLFSKNEQDDLVRTFVFGMGSGEGAAKPCIHALSICCHEIPLSVSKSLNTILQKLSQIITQSQVSIHVLEFLVGLSRTAQIYVNFRDEEYRTIFGICFRYLQYVRDEREKVSGAGHIRSSQAPNSQAGLPRKTSSPDVGNSSPNATEDLPQYVYALAYHVITFWFMSLKMVDRAKHIGWITKNLVSTDATGKEVLDEQAQVTVDMMQRVTYSDLDETLPDTQFVSSLDHSIIKKTWLMGLSLLTVETAVATGESQLTKRQPVRDPNDLSLLTVRAQYERKLI
ncbi:MAG: Tuberous sclerosis 2-like protein [Sclerophora amabilis]|nr:MAG: Tuberous sclerosis 2-like protein [Sclerophora amabilis]